MQDQAEGYVPLKWNVLLMRRNPMKGYVAAFCAVISVVLGVVLLGHWIFGVLGLWFFLTATIEYFYPITYTISQEGAQARCLWHWQQIKWQTVRRIYVGNEGVKLSSLENPSRLEAYRGVYLRFNNNREQVLGTIERWRPENAVMG